MMMHNNTKSGNKMFGGSEDIVWTNINSLTLRCDLDLEWCNPFFLTVHSGLWCCIIRPSLIVRESTFKKYSRKSHNLIIWALAVTLTLKIVSTKQKNITWHSGLWCCITIPILVTKWFMMLYYKTKFGRKRTSSLEDIVENSHTLIIWALAVTLTLKKVNQFSAWHIASWQYTTIPSVVQKRMVKRFRKYSADTMGHTDRTTDGETDDVIPIHRPPPPPPYLYGRGV